MLFLTLWILVLLLEISIASNQRSVNLALETVLQFDKADDSNVINKVKDFLSNIQVLLNKKPQKSDDVATRRKKEYKFTDFVDDLITTLNSFEDNDLKKIFRIVDKDFKKRRVDNDLIDDNVKIFLSRKLTEIRNQPAIKIRRDLDKLLRELRGDKNKKNRFFLDFMNSLYKRDSERKFSKLIKRLNLFLRSARKSKAVLKSIIVKVINDIIFEHYNNLKDNEKSYLKNFVKAYFTNYIETDENFKIKQRAEETEITKEIINTNEKIEEIKATKHVTEFQWTDIPNETTKKIFTHITLYPKSIRVKKISTGFPSLEIIESTATNEENIKDKSKEEETKETNKVFTNQSVEINVNLFLKRSRDSLEPDDSGMAKSFKFKSNPKVFQRALKKSKINTNYGKSSSPANAVEKFGNLYPSRTPKRYNYNKISRLGTLGSKTTMEYKYIKSTYVDDIDKENSLLEKKYFHGNVRRFNQPANLNEEKVRESDRKDIVSTPKLRSFTTPLVPLIISTVKFTTPVVTTIKSTTNPTRNVKLNEICNENVTDVNEVTENPLTERIMTNIESVIKKNTTPFENDSNNPINNMTIVDANEMSGAFNINNYIKNSEALNLDDHEKRKQIEARMKADLGNLLDSPPTNSTSDGFTDIFKELEDAFEI